MARNLAIFLSDTVEDYVRNGLSSIIHDYFNPKNFFDNVYVLSSSEKSAYQMEGLNIIPTQPEEIVNRLKELKIDIVRAYSGKGACELACSHKVRGVPVIVSIHDSRKDWLRSSIKRADCVFVVSESVQELVEELFSKKDMIWVLPNRIDLSIMKTLPAESYGDLEKEFPFKYKILQIGRKSREKNIETLIKAIAQLPDEYCLIAVGDGDSSYLQKLARELSVEKRCFFRNAIAHTEISRYMSFSDCVCQPSLTEAMSFAAIESLACGAVIIASSMAARGADIIDNYNGLLTDEPQDEQKLAILIEQACTDTELRTRLKVNAVQSAQKFSKDIIDALEISYYEKILAMRDSGAFDIPLISHLREKVQIWFETHLHKDNK
ncbi:MAG: glycosyltransferase family 4 protein [Candidatus Omnitrophica bacterium]|nr:glycosyltransferase family 4 protein [Candidatus Omnitrophota bacterium]